MINSVSPLQAEQAYFGRFGVGGFGVGRFGYGGFNGFRGFGNRPFFNGRNIIRYPKNEKEFIKAKARRNKVDKIYGRE